MIIRIGPSFNVGCVLLLRNSLGAVADAFRLGRVLQLVEDYAITLVLDIQRIPGLVARP